MPMKGLEIGNGNFSLLPAGNVAGTVRNIYPHSEDWVFVLLFFLFLFYAFSINRSFGWIRESISGLGKVRSRSSIFSNSTQTEYNSRHLLTIGGILTLSLFVYIEINNANEPVRLITWFWLMLATTGFLIIKDLIFRIVGYVFFDPSSFKAGKDMYFFAFDLLGILLYPFILLRIYWENQDHQLLIIIALFFMLLLPLGLVLKLIQIFYRNFLDLFYILLYLCTLEIIPAFLLFQVYRAIIKG